MINSRRRLNGSVALLLGLMLMICGLITAAAEQLSAEQAFQLSVKVEQHSVQLHWRIAPGYHLYRDRMEVKPVAGSGVKLGPIELPPGRAQHDQILGHYQVYAHQVTLTVPLLSPQHVTANSELWVNYQGCYGLSFCYPPLTKKINLYTASAQGQTAPAKSGLVAGNNRFLQLLGHSSLLVVVPLFLFFGLLLAFTPCVLPMLPILASIIVGQKSVSTKKAFVLSLVYVLSAALAFAVAGFVTALAGSSVQIFLQNRYVTLCMAALFVLLALSLFGLYELQLPAFMRQRINRQLQNQRGGTYLGTAMMGVLSSLIVSPCISAPLAGALIFISRSGDVLLGVASLFSLGLGMGLPLLVIGTLGGKLLIKTGRFMQFIKIGFGVVMLALAGWMVLRAYPSLMRGVTVKSNVVQSTAQLDALLTQAKQKHQGVVIDYFADWCLACQELDRKTLQSKPVQQGLRAVLLIRADLTANDQQTKALAARYQVFAPPTIIFIDQQGRQVHDATLYGYVRPPVFMQSLAMIVSSKKDDQH